MLCLQAIIYTSLVKRTKKNLFFKFHGFFSLLVSLY